MSDRTYNFPRTDIKTLFCLKPNEEDIHTTKNLTITDAYIQKLNPCNGNQDVVLPDSNLSDGMLFWIINPSISIGLLRVYDNNNHLLSTLASNQICHCICVGNEWGIYTPIGVGNSNPIDPSLYYTKTEVDTMLNNIQNNFQNQIDNIRYV